MDLEPIHPETALELYVSDRRSELTEASLQSHEYRLSHFVRWCDENGIENLNDLTGRRLHEYRLWRREEGDLAPVSEKTQQDTLRVFIRWLESVDGVENDLHTKVLSPVLSKKERARTVMLDADEATSILAHLERFEYASIQHITIALLWHTMLRTGGARALDVDDYDAEEQSLNIQHRPDTGTPIKNKHEGERMIALSEQVCDLLDDWIDYQRPSVTDEYERAPLLATSHGRVAKTTIRRYVYKWTRPCAYDGTCPHGREIDDCEAACHHQASKCPSSKSPHTIRRGSITHGLNNDMPDKVVSDRANVSLAVLDRHYDRRTKREKMEQRREYLTNL